MVTSLDFRKCYDTVNPFILTDKVAKLTGNAAFAEIIMQMVESRRIRCTTSTTTSDTLTCDLGIPQGSRIACILFLVFSYDLLSQLDLQTETALSPASKRTKKPPRHHIKAVQYADDANLILLASTLPGVIRRQRDSVEIVENWCALNDVQLNKIKTAFQFFMGLKISLERLNELVLARNAGSPNSKLEKAEKDAGLDVLPYGAPRT